MRRVPGSAAVVLIIWSSCATGAFAQTPQQAPQPVPPLAPMSLGCDSTDTACVATRTTQAAGRSERVPSGFGDLFKTLGQDFKSFPTFRTLSWLGASAALAVGSRAGDRAVASDLDDKPLRLFGAGRDMGAGQTQLGVALGTLAVGRFSGNREISSLGFQLVRANLMTQALTQSLKFATHRQRPDGTRWSFPSGHASTTFAAATVVQRRYGWKAGVPAYILASYVAASRVNDRRHFPSDVIFGAGLGIAVGMTVTRNAPGGGVLVPVVGPSRVGFVWTKAW